MQTVFGQRSMYSADFSCLFAASDLYLRDLTPPQCSPARWERLCSLSTICRCQFGRISH